MASEEMCRYGLESPPGSRFGNSRFGDLRLDTCPLTRAIAGPRGVPRAPQGVTLSALWSRAATAGGGACLLALQLAAGSFGRLGQARRAGAIQIGRPVYRC